MFLVCAGGVLYTVPELSSDFLTTDSGLMEVWVTILSMSVFHWARRVVSLPSQALLVAM